MLLYHFASAGVVLLSKWMRNILESTSSTKSILKISKEFSKILHSKLHVCMAVAQLSIRQKFKNFNILHNKNSICYSNVIDMLKKKLSIWKNLKLHNRVILGQNIIVK